MKHLAILALALTGLTACAEPIEETTTTIVDEASNSAPAQMTVHGRFAVSDSQKKRLGTIDSPKAVLWTMNDDTSESAKRVLFLQSVDIIDGKFTLTYPVERVRHVGIGIQANDGKSNLGKIDLILEPGEFNVDINTKRVDGGDYYQKIYGQWKTNPEYKELTAKLDEQNRLGNREKVLEFHRAAESIAQNALKPIVAGDRDPVAQYLAATTRHTGLSQNQRLEHLSRIRTLLPNHPSVQADIVRTQAAIQAQATRDGITLSSTIQDFSANDLDGNTVNLKQVMSNNKYVLVEFWASWCGPCRAEIPHMKRAYAEYNPKGFEIVSFTLDDSADYWEEASEEEDMPWINIGDLKAYASPVIKMYGVTSVPANYLVESATGKIVGKNLRQHHLDDKLKALLTSP